MRLAAGPLYSSEASPAGGNSPPCRRSGQTWAGARNRQSRGSDGDRTLRWLTASTGETSSKLAGLGGVVLSSTLSGRSIAIQAGPSWARVPEGRSEALDGVGDRRRRLPEQRRNHILDPVDHREQAAAAVAREALGDDLVDQRAERRPIAVDVQEQDRLVMQLQLPPGQHLERLVERPETAGQDDEGVGQLEHQALALVHAGDDAQVGDAVMPLL